MGYSKETYAAAKETLATRKAKAEAQALEIKEKFLSLNPDGRDLLYKIGSAGSRAAIAVVNGGDVRANLERLKEENLKYQQEFADLLKKNGLSKEDITPKYNCKKCDDTGYVDGYMCSCLKELLKTTAYESLNKITPLSLCTFDSFNLDYYRVLPENQRKLMESNYNFCRNYAENFSCTSANLIFQGGTGLGKTHLSLAIAYEAIKKGFAVVYGSVQNFASAIERERFDRDNSEDTSSLLSSADLLILDDLGTEFPSTYVSSVIYNIVDTRIMRRLPTIISTNLKIDEIQSRYGERLVSRIFGCYSKLPFMGKDIRILKKTGKITE